MRRADRPVARSQNMTRLAKYSADLYVKLEEETGHRDRHAPGRDRSPLR
jgi:hypothetical protein